MRQRTVGQTLVTFEGQQIFLLRRHQFRAVNLHQGLPLFDRLPFLIDEQPLDPAVDLAVDRKPARLFVGEQAGGANGPGQIPPGDLFGPHPHALHGNRIDGDATGRVPFVDRNQIHAHVVLARFLTDVGGVHGRHPMLDLPFGHGRAAGVVLARRQLHPADRAKPRLVLNDEGVHPTGVLNLFRRSGSLPVRFAFIMANGPMAAKLVTDPQGRQDGQRGEPFR